MDISLVAVLGIVQTFCSCFVLCRELINQCLTINNHSNTTTRQLNGHLSFDWSSTKAPTNVPRRQHVRWTIRSGGWNDTVLQVQKIIQSMALRQSLSRWQTKVFKQFQQEEIRLWFCEGELLRFHIVSFSIQYLLAVRRRRLSFIFIDFNCNLFLLLAPDPTETHNKQQTSKQRRETTSLQSIYTSDLGRCT